MPSLRRNFDAVEKRRAVRTAMVALIGVKPHLAVTERAYRLAVCIPIVGHPHPVVPVRRTVESFCTCPRLYSLGDGAEMGGKPALVVLRQALIAEQQNGVLVPGIYDCAGRFIVQGAAEIDSMNFCPNGRMQLDHRN